MELNREMNALLKLIDDPDKIVFESVTERIRHIGKSMIPSLESLWETSEDETVQDRIEMLIHKLHFDGLRQDFSKWSSQDSPDLLEGSFLVSRYKFPELDLTGYRKELDRICKSVWLELNNYLTPLEQINVLNKVLFTYHMFKGVEISYGNQEDFLVHKLLDSRRGNSIANGILYQTVCGMLDIPVRAIHIPRQFILAYFDRGREQDPTSGRHARILFYIDPMTGQIFTKKDVDHYFGRIVVDPKPDHFKPMHPRSIVAFQIEEFAKCFDDEKSRYKQNELLGLGFELTADRG
jgi:regulator of sirC expression with transglutaminase-like and TPR domain